MANEKMRPRGCLSLAEAAAELGLDVGRDDGGLKAIRRRCDEWTAANAQAGAGKTPEMPARALAPTFAGDGSRWISRPAIADMKRRMAEAEKGTDKRRAARVRVRAAARVDVNPGAGEAMVLASDLARWEQKVSALEEKLAELLPIAEMVPELNRRIAELERDDRNHPDDDQVVSERGWLEQVLDLLRGRSISSTFRHAPAAGDQAADVGDREEAIR